MLRISRWLLRQALTAPPARRLGFEELESRVVPTGVPAYAAGAAPGGEPRV